MGVWDGGVLSDVIQGMCLRADLFWMLLTCPSLDHPAVRGKKKKKVHDMLHETSLRNRSMFVQVNLGKPCFPKFKANNMCFFFFLSFFTVL